MFDDFAEVLYGYAVLAEGSELTEPLKFNQALMRVLAKGLAIQTIESRQRFSAVASNRIAMLRRAGQFQLFVRRSMAAPSPASSAVRLIQLSRSRSEPRHGGRIKSST